MMADTASASEGVGLPEPASLEVEGGDVSRETSSASSDSAAEGATEESGVEGESAPAPGAEQAKSLFQNLLAEDDKPAQAEEEELPPEVQAGSRAADTIKGLRARAQRAESEHTNLQQAMGQNQRQFQQWANNFQSQFNQLRDENVQLRAQLQYAPKPPQAPKTEAQAYIDQLENQIRERVNQEMVAPLQRQLQEYGQRWDQFSQQQQHQQNQAQIQQDARVFQDEASRYWRNTVLREVPQDVDVPDVGKYLVLAAQAYNPNLAANPEMAAKLIRRTILETADLIQRHAGSSVRKAVTAGKDAATSIQRGAADGATKEASPNMDVLIHNGFDSPMDWKDAGRPRLRPLPKAA